MKKAAARRHGFVGQHMIVLPEPVRATARRHALLRGLLVTDAGYFPQAAGHCVERPVGAPTDLLMLCLRGRGWVRFAGDTRQLQAGAFAWLPAGHAHAYGSSDEASWTIAWAHFTGDEVKAWRELFGLPTDAAGHTGDVPVDRLDEIALDHVHAALERGYGRRDLVTAAAALRSSFCAIARLGVATGATRPARERVAASVAALRRDWVRPHRLAELAAAAGLSPAHYSALFRQLTGFAPIDFLIRMRVRHACHLLDTTATPVATIAEEVGYADPYYFTRCFRRVMGCSPRAYRMVPKG